MMPHKSVGWGEARTPTRAFAILSIRIEYRRSQVAGGKDWGERGLCWGSCLTPTYKAAQNDGSWEST